MSKRTLMRSRTQGDLTVKRDNNDEPNNRIDVLWKHHVNSTNHNDQSTKDTFTGYRCKSYPHNGDRYEGNYRNGKRHGIGVYLWFNGEVQLCQIK